MAEDFGNGVTRTLSALARQFSAVVWQSGKPPLDSELNLMAQVDFEALRQEVRSQVHSGFFLDPTRAADDYNFNPLWSNHFHFGQFADNEHHPHIYAVVDGMVVPIAGVNSETLDNIIKLSPPPTTDARTDFVFLEVWRTLVAPNPSTENKPNAAEVFKFGNTQHVGVNIPDDIQDPAIGIETTERIQIQYRIRVHGHGHGLGSGTALDAYPDGLEDPNILGQGAGDEPVDGMHFHNMRGELGDPSLWRSGDGNPDNGLSTVDGYVYAIPICAVFRRNGTPYKAVMSGLGAPNHNGAANRTPGSSYLPNPRDGAVKLTQCTLSAEIHPEDIGDIKVEGLLGSGLEDPYLFFVPGEDNPRARFLALGEGEDVEFIEYTGGVTSNTPETLTVTERGRGGSMARRWPAGTKVSLHMVRPDHRYADQVVNSDVLDLRRGLNFGDWDYERLLLHNVAALAKGNLRTAYKMNGAGGDSQGPVLHAVDYMMATASADGAAIPDHVDVVDGPDGVRQVWSDAAVMQTGITALLDNSPNTDGENFTSTTFSEGLNWEIDGKLRPTGFMNSKEDKWENGSVIFLHLGGQDGESGLRRSFKGVRERAVRFISPYEMWKSGFPEVDPNNGNQYPWQVRLQGQVPFYPLPVVDLEGADITKNPGPWHPTHATGFERPFLFLGGLTYRGATYQINPAIDLKNPDQLELNNFEGIQKWKQVDLGVDFMEAGVFFNSADPMNPDSVAKPCLHGTRTLYDLITNGGTDRSGRSSKLYLVMYGENRDGYTSANNGAYKVIGFGSKDDANRMTDAWCTNSTSLAVVNVAPESQPMDFEINAADLSQRLEVQLRTPFTHANDGEGSASGVSAACIVLTDIKGEQQEFPTPWTGFSSKIDYASKMVVSGSVLYSPSRGGTCRVPDQIERLAVRDGGNQYLKNDVNDIDLEWNGQTSHPTAERHYSPTHVQLWNRLPSLGWDAPNAPHYGGRVVLRSEQDRECELFIDHGSKTVVFRPFQRREMTLRFTDYDQTEGIDFWGGGTYSAGLADGLSRDPADIFTTDRDVVFALPQETMPRFGRQDIPFHTRTGDTDPFMSGINHLFVDSQDETEDVFAIIGGEDNQGDSLNKLVEPLLFQTDTIYGKRDEIDSSTHPTIGARKVYLPEVISSDLGYGMRGIELPPNYGVARLYAIYERGEFENKLQDDTPGGFDSTGALARINPIVNGPTNLLKTDAVKQTLFIRKGGGYQEGVDHCDQPESITGHPDDHTYIIPSDVIDHTLAENWSEGMNFEDMEYVVECVVFGFARGFISKNTYVLARKHSGVPQDLASIAETDFEFNNVQMVVPTAANTNDESYIAYARTPYQGDPFMTRDGDSLDPSDYQHRYGEIPLNKAKLLGTRIRQFDEQGNLLIDRPNPRAFEILASVDFYTTMGTGKIGGKLYPGTFMDVGVIEPSVLSATRIPSDSQIEHERSWHVQSRAYTEGQLKNTNRASVSLGMGASESALLSQSNGHKIVFTLLDRQTLTFTGVKKDPDGTYVLPDGFNVTDNNRYYFVHIDPDATHAENVRKTVFSFLKSLTESRLARESFQLNLLGIHQADDGGTTVKVQALQTGVVGNKLRVEVISPLWDGSINDDGGPPMLPHFSGECVSIEVPQNNEHRAPYSRAYVVPINNYDYPDSLLLTVGGKVSAAHFAGGVDMPVNAGLGESQLNLTGMTERLPLGILLKDSDFICENPLGDNATAFRTATSSIRPIQNVLPLAKDGQEYDRFYGAPGEMLSMSDASINWYTPYQSEPDTGTGTRKFRIHRGGGAVFNLSGDKPGGPIDWVSESMPKSLDPVMKGGALACKALLVRNFHETAFSSGHQPEATKRSDGDEIQMVVITHGVLGNNRSLLDGISISGEISPTGFGEGYSAADRYRIQGRPMHKARRRDFPDPSMPPLAYPGEDE